MLYTIFSCETKPSERVNGPGQYFDAGKLAELEAMLDTETGIVLKLFWRIFFEGLVDLVSRSL